MIPRIELSDDEILTELFPFIIFKEEDSREFKSKVIKKLIKYVNSSKYSLDNIKERIIETNEFLEFIGLSSSELMHIFNIDNKILEKTFAENITKYALLAQIADKKTGTCIRDEILTNHSDIFLLPTDIIYSRIKHLMSDGGKLFMNTSHITLTPILLSPKEFTNNFKITDEELSDRYPFDTLAKTEIFLWDENRKLFEKIRASNRIV